MSRLAKAADKCDKVESRNGGGWGWTAKRATRPITHACARLATLKTRRNKADVAAYTFAKAANVCSDIGR